jgi:methyltransferase-like protein 6
MDEEFDKDFLISGIESLPELTEEQKLILEKQNSRKVSEFQANKLELQAARNWDVFYKRNETRFFKDR